jgi:transcriptional regulator GlxA family with amidase domain
MQPNEEISAIIHNIMTEEHGEKVGKQALIKKFMDQLVIHIFRDIYDHQEYKSQISKLDYLLDKRLINIIEHIQNNLDQDLSNQKIADLAYVSRDYIGQFFKSLTNHNLQDYIENRRLEQAHYLLRSSTDSVQEIARRVGFKDPAYFSRRFRLKYNQKARDIRETDILMA